jgi:hypothetical protein
MTKDSFTRIAMLLAAAAASVAPLGAATFHDEMLTVGGGQLAVAELPDGAAGTPTVVDSRITAIYALPSGKILAAAAIPTGDPPPFSVRYTLNELEDDGSLRQLSVMPGNDQTASAQVVDMDLDSRGRFYLLLRYPSTAEPSGFYWKLHQVDPANGNFLAVRDVPNANSIATAPKGLWILVDGRLRNLDTETGHIGPEVAHFGSAGNVEATSSGRLYFNRVCSPPCSRLATFDPETGGNIEEAPSDLYDGVPGLTRFTIRRLCYESDNTRCLGDGRFRTEVSYRAFDGLTGPAVLAPDRSRDTSIFYFFEPDNWELMVKVLDACAINDHFWVYSSASTDVAFTMTITDTKTGAQRIYSNPLGQLAETVTDGNAFPCSN